MGISLKTQGFGRFPEGQETDAHLQTRNLKRFEAYAAVLGAFSVESKDTDYEPHLASYEERDQDERDVSGSFIDLQQRVLDYCCLED